ncbi:MAG: hypothetical protein KIY12_03395 [Thermoplasmata archaeon]|uniref:Uncharacterized protein n=1 Tax=Candidatus Sysuiplasma superficiale TaxID=2823368 RepID=A0A8J7YSA2_9ARCH|nr:hypothetical protein [Candidatus Sysuiplasma superficiale]MBX8643751.1 hypothetical protein [Candidatus Sysuiplasma superficiale]MCL4346799.1 hypothetical protein [Candidatus Thermoplasmatota archaeon]MCL5437083.1 hypothetical protein [Candidatus Thermoplasmatota archaeon]
MKERDYLPADVHTISAAALERGGRWLGPLTVTEDAKYRRTTAAFAAGDKWVGSTER